MEESTFHDVSLLANAKEITIYQSASERCEQITLEGLCPPSANEGEKHCTAFASAPWFETQVHSEGVGGRRERG